MTLNASSSLPSNKTVAEVVELNTMADPHEEHENSAGEPLISSNSERDHANNNADTDPSAGANLFVWALTLSACVSGLLFGYDTGVISSTLVSIGSDLSNRPLTTLDKGLITSSVSAFALIASPVAGVWSDKIGRKNIIIASDGLFILGALVQAFAGSVWAMILGRSIVGIAIGGASLITPLYISELAPSHMRGRLVTVSLLFITGGQVVAYVVGWAFSSVLEGWRWMVGLGGVPAVAQVLMLVGMPETPRWLCKVGREGEARWVLMRVYRGIVDDVEGTVTGIVKAINREIDEEQEVQLQTNSKQPSTARLPPTLHSLLFQPPHRRALTITCMLQGLQQLCGFNSLMYYSATIFSLLRFSSPTLTSLSIALTNFVFTVVAFYLIDRIGRRRILLLTIPIMAVALLLCSAAFSLVDLPHHSSAQQSNPNSNTTPSANDDAGGKSTSRTPAIAILMCLLLYVSAYATALGPVPWQQSELFPLSVRSLGSSIATATNWGSNTIVGLTFLPMMDIFGAGWTFVGYAVVCAVGWGCVWGIYPETMGMGLEEISGLLREGFGVKESMEMVKRMKEAERRERRRGDG